MNPSGTNLAKTIAGVISSAEPGSFGPVLRGLLVACTALRNKPTMDAGLYLDSPNWKLRALSELIENAAVYAERNRL